MSQDVRLQEIGRIAGIPVLEAAAEIETVTGIVYLFTTGSMVQVFHLPGGLSAESWSGRSNCQILTRRLSTIAHHSDLTPTSGGGDHLIKLWDVGSGREVKTLVGHEDDVHAVAFTPDGKSPVSTGDDKTVRMWNVAAGSVRHVFEGHTRSVPALAVSPDGRLAASGSRDGTVRTGTSLRWSQPLVWMATRMTCMPSRFHQTAGCSPPPATIGRPGCGVLRTESH